MSRNEEDSSKMEEDSNNEEFDEERNAIKSQLSTMSFEDLQKLEEKIGTKVYKEALFGKNDKKESSEKKIFKRENKNRPRERSAKKPVRKLGVVHKVKKRVAREPRLEILDIHDLPVGTPLETPLHPRKRRAWDPMNSSDAPGVIKRASSTLEEQDTTPPSPALMNPSESSPSKPRRLLHASPPPRRLLEDIMANYGSEADCSDDEDEELTPMLVSRVLVGSMDTPLDQEEEEPKLPTALPIDMKQEPHIASPSHDHEGALQPNDFFHFEWSRYPDPPVPPNERREPFTQVGVGPTEPCQDPYTIFTSIWDAQIMERIVCETNKYAQDIVLRRLQNNNLSPRSRICSWQDTCVNELYTYFAIILAMGIVIKTRVEEYWTSDSEIFDTPGFRVYMSLHRFQLLNTCLHFNDNGNMNARELSIGEAKLFKVEPIVNHLNSKFQTMYTMCQNIALDESLLQWKGWLSINQFISNKSAKVGIKTYEVCESQTGYLWRFSIHAKKHHAPQEQQSPLDAATSSIVLDLLRGLEGHGYTVWMDNFYNSPALARHLKAIGFDVVGTLRTNRQFVPQALRALQKSDMRKDQITGYTSGDVDLLVWLDENRVATISTYHGNQTAVSEGKVKPTVVLDYNVMMGGVDKKDQLLSMYPIERKRTKIWYKKLFRRLLNISALNSYIIAKKSGAKMHHRKFRKCLISSILSRHSKPRNVPMLTPKQDPNKMFLAKTHHLMQYEIGANKSRLRRKCCVCKKLTHFYCAGCEKAVCISACFVSLHS